MKTLVENLDEIHRLQEIAYDIGFSIEVIIDLHHVMQPPLAEIAIRHILKYLFLESNYLHVFKKTMKSLSKNKSEEWCQTAIRLIESITLEYRKVKNNYKDIEQLKKLSCSAKSLGRFLSLAQGEALDVLFKQKYI